MSSFDGTDGKSSAAETPLEKSYYTVVNRLCIKKGVHLDSGFVSGVKAVFGAKVDQMDFYGAYM